MKLKPIGTVKSMVIKPLDHNWGEIISEIHLNDSLKGGLKGIELFSHAIIIFYMHQATFNIANHLIRRPRDRIDMPLIGIFAQRAKHRPNPIGITVVSILDVQGNILKVKGLDAIDGTPVLDIKPYFPIFDKIKEVTVPMWVNILMRGYFNKD